MDKYILYYHPYSICSLQVMYTIAIVAADPEGDSLLEVEPRSIDIFNDAQLDETFLTKVNPKGQVPVLTSPKLQHPIADSLLITNYLIEHWPCLNSSQHSTVIKQALQDIHSLNYFALSFPDRPQVAEKLVSAVEYRLAMPDLSSEYKKALAYKLAVTIEEKYKGIRPENTHENEEKARKLFDTLESYLHDTPWLFGLDRPTALDTHTIILIGRLQDVGRTALVPKRLLAYAAAAFETPELQRVMQGRRTMIKLS